MIYFRIHLLLKHMHARKRTREMRFIRIAQCVTMPLVCNTRVHNYTRSLFIMIVIWLSMINWSIIDVK